MTRKARPRPTAMALWFVIILLGAAVIWLLLVIAGVADANTSLIAVAWLLIAASACLSALTRARRRRRFQQRFPTPESLRAHVDTDALRTVRDRDGQVQAVRQLRRAVPDLPLPDAVQLIKGL